MKTPVLIKGEQLTSVQKSMLKFKGMQNPDFVRCHSFYFIEDAPASVDSGYFYPVCNSLEFLPN